MTVKLQRKKFNLALWVPKRLVIRILFKKAEESGFESEDFKRFRKDALAVLKNYKREYGSFELLHVESKDGTKLIIKI